MSLGDEGPAAGSQQVNGQSPYRVPGAHHGSLVGTYVYDGAHARVGYQLNRFFVSLRDPANRHEFVSDPETYLAGWPLSDTQRTAILERRWITLFEQGMNIFAGAILGAIDGRNIQSLGSEMAGITEEEFHEMLRTAVRPVTTTEVH